MEPGFAALKPHLPPLTSRRRPSGFAALLKLIVEQQLSVKAAETIWGRVEVALGEVTPEAVRNATEDSLRACGLSRPKIAYGKGMAEAVADGSLDFAAVAAMEPEAAIAALIRIKGIGRWSAEVYLMFSEGRTDLFPVGDIALREALGWFDSHELRPDEATARLRSQAFAPHRTAAAHVLWAWYGAVGRGELGRDLCRDLIG